MRNDVGGGWWVVGGVCRLVIKAQGATEARQIDDGWAQRFAGRFIIRTGLWG